MEILFFILFIGLIIFAAIMSHRAVQKRIADLNAFALANQLSFTPDKDPTFSFQFSFFEAFQRGHSQYAYNIFKGLYKNRSLLAFDYHYAVTHHDSKGRSQTTHYYFSAVILSVDFPLKSLILRPEGFFDKVGGFLGFGDINFESSEFSKKFFVTAKDKKFAYDVIHQGMMEYLLANPGYLMQIDRHDILIYQNKIFKPEDFAKCFDFGIGFIEKIPEYLIKELKGNVL